MGDDYDAPSRDENINIPSTDDGEGYVVTTQRTCTCPDFQNRCTDGSTWCKHNIIRWAVESGDGPMAALTEARVHKTALELSNKTLVRMAEVQMDMVERMLV